jgi:predicted TIM-barrel fold metal-dependent hydrolase
MLGKVAVEEHFVTAELADTIFGSIGWDVDAWRKMRELLLETEDLRLGEMDRNGIELSVLSLAAPCLQAITDVEAATAGATAANDALAAVVQRHPRRYAGLAALALQDPDAATRELVRAVGELGMKGALVNGFSSSAEPDSGGARYYDEGAFIPFWEQLEELGVPLYLHPRNPLEAERRIYRGREELLGPTWAFTVETATHALRLITSGLFDRCPDLTIVLGHMGELLPFAIQRFEQRLSRVEGGGLRRSPSQCLRENFYLTTSGNFHTQSLIGAILEVGADRMLFAVDYPFEESSEAASWFDNAPIGEGNRRLIGRDNAVRAFALEL